MLDSIILRRHVLISVLSIVVVPNIMAAQGRAIGAGAKSCALLTRQLVEKFSAASKKPVDAAGPRELPLGANGTGCEWGDLALQVDPWSPARLDSMRQIVRQGVGGDKGSWGRRLSSRHSRRRGRVVRAGRQPHVRGVGQHPSGEHDDSVQADNHRVGERHRPQTPLGARRAGKTVVAFQRARRGAQGAGRTRIGILGSCRGGWPSAAARARRNGGSRRRATATALPCFCHSQLLDFATTRTKSSGCSGA